MFDLTLIAAVKESNDMYTFLKNQNITKKSQTLLEVSAHEITNTCCTYLVAQKLSLCPVQLIHHMETDEMMERM